MTDGVGELCTMKNFPLLIPQNDKHTMYKGFLTAEGEEFFVSFYIPKYPSPRQMSMQCTWELSILLSEHRKELEEWRQQQPSFYTYLECLQNLIASHLQRDIGRRLPKPDSHLSVRTLKDIAVELESIGAGNVMHVSSTCTTIVVKEVDAAGRSHLLTLKLALTYPNTLPLVEADLPEAAHRALNKKSSLSAIHRAFVQQINLLQELWNVMDEVDGQCWVLDPEHATRKDVHRRIMIGNNVSLQLTVDPFNANQLPDMKFLGSEHGILPFQMAFADNVKLWSSERRLLANMKAMLDTNQLPLAPTATQQSDQLVHQGECAICVMMQLNGQVASKCCDNDKCGAIYHVSCLFEWLQTVPTSKKAFNYIIGDCPNCFSTVSCQRPS